MNKTRWVLLDTETSGLNSPIFVVELAAQQMLGWDSVGPSFRKLLNQNQEIPPEASRVHGYTREILERDGETPLDVYCEFAEYVGGLPLASFNLNYDLDEVLLPEWKRLGIDAIGLRGFCALRLAQRLLDPVPAGNCKLQTLRQYYRLPEHGAHTALGDVQTVAELLGQVLRPIAEKHGLETWEQIVAFASEEWYPSRIAFGKHKGRLIQEARKDLELKSWLEWLANTSNNRSARMGRWYLKQLEIKSELSTDYSVFSAPDVESKSSQAETLPDFEKAALITYANPELMQIRMLVACSRARLAELEVTYTKEKSHVDTVQAILFQRLRTHYQKRDRIKLIVECRKKYLDSLIRSGEEEAKRVEEDFRKAKARSDRDYEETAAAVAKKKPISAEEEAELSTLWKKLVKLYHPDRFAHEPSKREAYEKLTGAINSAKDNGDLDTLREISKDPHSFILRQGWATLDFEEEIEVIKLRRLYETIQLQIVAIIESLGQLRESSEYELYQLSQKKPGLLDELATERAKILDVEIEELEKQANSLANEIEELQGREPVSIK